MIHQFSPPPEHAHLVKAGMLRVSVNLSPSLLADDNLDSLLFATMEEACQYLDGYMPSIVRERIKLVSIRVHDWKDSGEYWRSDKPNVYNRSCLESMIGYRAVMPPANLEGSCIGVFVNSSKERVVNRVLHKIGAMFESGDWVRGSECSSKEAHWSSYPLPPFALACPFGEILRISRILESHLHLFHQEGGSLFLHTAYNGQETIGCIALRISGVDIQSKGRSSEEVAL